MIGTLWCGSYRYSEWPSNHVESVGSEHSESVPDLTAVLQAVVDWHVYAQPVDIYVFVHWDVVQAPTLNSVNQSVVLGMLTAKLARTLALEVETTHKVAAVVLDKPTKKGICSTRVDS